MNRVFMKITDSGEGFNPEMNLFEVDSFWG